MFQIQITWHSFEGARRAAIFTWSSLERRYLSEWEDRRYEKSLKTRGTRGFPLPSLLCGFCFNNVQTWKQKCQNFNLVSPIGLWHHSHSVFCCQQSLCLGVVDDGLKKASSTLELGLVSVFGTNLCQCCVCSTIAMLVGALEDSIEVGKMRTIGSYE